jgi:hypothetical protein
MKFTLKDYQDDAVAQVLDRLKKAKKRWHEDGEKNAFSLTATTGAGKTVMAAAVFEALFFGSDDYEFEPDPGAVVIWFSDDPSLNEQSRWRLQEAADKLTTSDLVTVESTFSREVFEPGKVYFLNTQKLGKNSMLVRGADPSDQGVLTVDGTPLMPDGRSHTIWDTIRNTIEDPDLTLYLVLDEAHRGVSGTATGRETIVKRLINGQGAVPGIPVVWGISATVKRFDDAIQAMPDLTKMPNVLVNSKLVQESGLIKDTITLDVPEAQGDVATVLLQRGTRKFKEISEAWAEYAAQQGDTAGVVPLMVLQVPNSPSRPKRPSNKDEHDEWKKAEAAWKAAVTAWNNDIGNWLKVIFDTWSDLPENSVFNVFGEHKTESFGGFSVPYIEPQRVQDDEQVRVLLAKDAISTGWDCPRAEVMVSFRSASDQTHITQLLGRMVRTPLARRIPGNERLNAVDCLLPKFNQATVKAVVAALMTGGEAGDNLPGRRVLINPKEMAPNPNVPQAVWDKLTSLPSAAKPKKQARPVKRLTALGHELAADSLLPNAGKQAHAHLHSVLDAQRIALAADIAKARADVLTVEGKSVKTDIETQKMTFDDFVEAADYAVIEDAYKRAARLFSPDLAKTYSEHLADQNDDAEDYEEALIEAHTDIAAFGLIDTIKTTLETEAEALANTWLTTHDTAIKALTDERQDVYRELRELSADPLNVTLAAPKISLQPTIEVREDKSEVAIPTYEHHLLCDEDGLFPFLEDSSWEPLVINTESSLPGAIAWYRNPKSPKPESLGVVYDYGGDPEIMRPDFIFFIEQEDGTISANIVDPHGTHLEDALPKLRGLCDYAATHGQNYERIEAVAEEPKGVCKCLDLKSAEVRGAVMEATKAAAMFSGPFSKPYPSQG